VIRCVKLFAVGIENSVMVPLIVILPILLPPISVNHNSPLGPAMMPPGLPDTLNSDIVPPRVIFPILLPFVSVNQTFPFGPAAMLNGCAADVGSANSSDRKGAHYGFSSLYGGCVRYGIASFLS
jgi:hypothetical protein